MTDRASLRAEGEAMRRRLFGAGDDGAPANMRTLNTEAVYGAIQTAPLSGFAPALNALGGLGEALA